MDANNTFTMPEEPISHVRLRVAPAAPCDDASLGAAEGTASCGSEEEEVRRFLPIVHVEAARFIRRLPRSVLKEDLVSAGTVGLLDALRRGTSNRDARFEQYIRIRIRGAMLDEIRREDWLSRAERAKQRAAVSATNVIHLEDLADGGANTASEQESPADLAERTLFSSAMIDALQSLPEREREILEMIYLNGWRAKDVATKLGVSEPRISQLHARAVARLRDSLASWQEAA